MRDVWVAESPEESQGLEPVDYDEPLFRGYINAAEQARHILEALRGDRMLPQTLTAQAAGEITCDLL